MRILVSGASGFLGSHLIEAMLARGHTPVALVRKSSDTALFARFFHELLQRGVYFPPAQFEAAFVSLAHTESDIDATVRAAGEIFRELRA